MAEALLGDDAEEVGEGPATSRPRTRGCCRAATLVERFEGVRLTAFYLSPSSAVSETMEPLAEARRLEIRTSDALIEMDAGAWTQ